MTLEDINTYRPAILAMQYLQRKDKASAAGALENLVATADFGRNGAPLVKAIIPQ